MREISLHILDVAKNSVVAEASLVELSVDEDEDADRLTVVIKDDGNGMDADFLKRVRDPFTTSRTTRNVGMGIPLFESAASMSGGGFDIDSAPGAGTTVTAWFGYSHIDRQPLGDMPSTVITLITGNPDMNFIYKHTYNGETFELDTRQIKEILQGVPIDSFEVAAWLKEYISEGLNSIKEVK